MANQASSNLFRGSEDEILQNLDYLRDTGSLSNLGSLLENVLSQPSDRVRKKILELIADIKNKAATPIIANFSLACNDSPIQLELISASWQSRLDFSDYLQRYIDLAIEGELLLVHEVLTLVEENCDRPEQNELSNSIAKIKTRLNSFSEEKKLLMVDLLQILEDKKNTKLHTDM